MYGLVASVPISTPFAKNATCWTPPSLSPAVASIVTVAGDGNVAPSAGLVIDTVGGVFGQHDDVHGGGRRRPEPIVGRDGRQRVVAGRTRSTPR